MDRTLEPQQSLRAATAPSTAPATETGGGAQQFTTEGAIPPVAGAAPASGAAPPPSASDRAFGGGLMHGLGKIGQEIGGAGKKVGQEVEVGAAEAVGVAELAGLRYPVKPYEAQVDWRAHRGSSLIL